MFNEFPKKQRATFSAKTLLDANVPVVFASGSQGERYGNPWLLGNPTKSFTFSPVFFSLRVAMVQFLMFRENHYQQERLPPGFAKNIGVSKEPGVIPRSQGPSCKIPRSTQRSERKGMSGESPIRYARELKKLS